MTSFGKLTRIGIAAAAAIVLLSVIVSTASAQAALPFKAFGSGQQAGVVVSAWNGATLVGSTIVDVNGNWQIDIQPTSADSGDVISFKLNGALAVQTVVFRPGLFTPVPGLALTLAAGIPAPAATGNAGLIVDAGAPIAGVLLLSLVALVVVAGARRSTRRTVKAS